MTMLKKEKQHTREGIYVLCTHWGEKRKRWGGRVRVSRPIVGLNGDDDRGERELDIGGRWNAWLDDLYNNYENFCVSAILIKWWATGSSSSSSSSSWPVPPSAGGTSGSNVGGSAGCSTIRASRLVRSSSTGPYTGHLCERRVFSVIIFHWEEEEEEERDEH